MGLRMIRMPVSSMTRGGHRRVGVRISLIQALMRSAGVVMDRVLGQDPAQMPWPENQYPVQELTAERSDDTFADRVGPHRRLHLIQMIGTDVSG